MAYTRLILLCISLNCSFNLLVAKVGKYKDERWRRITVMKSTREDVERIFGKAMDQGYYTSTYLLAEGNLSVEYSIGNCKSKIGWNVPEWTVIKIYYELKTDISYTPSDLSIDLNTFDKVGAQQCTPEAQVYIDERNGIECVVVNNKTLLSIAYSPPPQFDSLRCQS